VEQLQIIAAQLSLRSRLRRASFASSLSTSSGLRPWRAARRFISAA